MLSCKLSTRSVAPVVHGAAVIRSPLGRAQQRVRRAAGPEGEQSQTSSSKAATDDPVWVRREKEKAAGGGGDLPFGVYLLLSSIVAIAAVGSCFEWANKNPIFGVVQPHSPLYTPILAVFALTGLPTAGFLFYKAISSANAAADRMDQADGS